MKELISVAGRNPHPIVRPCNDYEEALRVATKMDAEGYRSVTIDGFPFVNGLDRLMSVLAILDKKSSDNGELNPHPISELSYRWNPHWGDVDQLVTDAVDQQLITKTNNGIGSFVVQRLVVSRTSNKDSDQ